ncbi:MAG: hypothetical protein Q9170_000698 [Blastenia crenularia]
MSSSLLKKSFSLDLPQHKVAQIKEDEADDVLQVIGAGLPRTGTTSLKAALEILGFDPCHHMAECFDKPSRGIIFANILHTQTNPHASPEDSANAAAQLKKTMRGYKATVDSPGCDLYAELMDLYPDAKVVLSVRDSDEKWWKSFTTTVGQQLGWKYRFLVYPIGFLQQQQVVVNAVMKRWTNILGPGAEVAPQVHSAHNQLVKKTVPKERLLEFNVKMGWPKLCEFLDVPVPAEPFPNL